MTPALAGGDLAAGGDRPTRPGASPSPAARRRPLEPVSLIPIGRVRSSLTTRDQAPRQGAGSGQRAVIELRPDLAPGLEGLRPGQRLWVLYWFHQADEPRLRVHPRGEASRPLTGVFNTRSPARPNPIGLTLVRLEAVEGSRLVVSDLEAIDGSPVLDLKPHAAVDAPAPEP